MKSPKFQKNAKFSHCTQKPAKWDNCVIYCTVQSEFAASLISTTLVEEKLAACVSIIHNVVSVYSWEGMSQTDNELILMIKTRKKLFNAIKNRILELHDAQLPEIIAVPITMGLDGYQKWIADETTVSETLEQIDGER